MTDTTTAKARKSPTTNASKKSGIKRNPSTEHAAEQKLGTVGTGDDGYMYMVAERKNKSRYWKKLALAKNFTKPKPPAKNIGCVNIWIGEIAAIGASDLPQKDKAKAYRNGLLGIGNIMVTPKFLKVLRKPPRKASCGADVNADEHNAYIFGKLYTSDYYFIGRHGNDMAQTGIVQITGLTKDDIKKFSRYQPIEGSKKMFDPWDLVYKNLDYKWDNAAALKKIREVISDNILFVGRTYGGDVGASIFVHFDKARNINSIIINNGCLFSFLNRM